MPCRIKIFGELLSFFSYFALVIYCYTVASYRLTLIKPWFAVFFAIALAGCIKGQYDITPVTGKGVPITVVVDQTKPGYRISSEFEGLSFETGLLAQDGVFLSTDNTVAVQLIKNLGRGILRIGGNSSDEVEWAGSEPSGKTLMKKLTTTDIDHLAEFSKAINWRVIFGLNLGHYNPEAAADEAFYVENRLGSSLYALQSGNEPDVFNHSKRPVTYGCSDYQKEWESYLSSVRSLAPKARFAGPDIDPFNPAWLESFAKNEHQHVVLLDGHYYSTGPASDAAITYHDLLKPNPRLNSYLVQLNKISAKYRLPYRISEGNSVWGRGKPGVSDVFASALWALDFMWSVAENNGRGVNFHGGMQHFAYSPIAVENGAFVPRPEYYAMLAFKYGGVGGTVIPATIEDPRDYNNCTAYACANANNTYTVTLINKEDAKNFAFTIQLNKTASTIQVDRLIAPSITSKTDVTFAGSAVSTDGTFTPSSEEHTVNNKNFVVYVPAGSAAVVTIK